MKKIGYYLFSLLLVMPLSWAASPEQAITLAQASKAAGLNAGAQQRLLKLGIDLNQLALGVADGYSNKPDANRLIVLNKSSSLFPSPSAKSVKTPDDKNALAQASFDLGILLAVENQPQLKTMDVSAFSEGFKTSYKKNIVSAKLAAAYLVVSNYYQQQRMQGAEESLLKSLAFLTENSKRNGVVMTASGLQYEVLVEGTGAKPTLLDMVTVNYRHSKPDSDFIYDSAAEGHSETMAMRGAMPEGWHELFLLMNKGARYRVYLPPALGFGAEGNGDALLPNEVLITEFTLLDIIPPPAVAY